ncbi:19131_t:CDS:2, partial [Racocetra fulgida]
CIVRVFLRKPPEKWVYVEEGLQGDVSILFELNFTHIKFVLDVAETSIQKSFHQGPNAFDLLMKNSQNTQLPELKKENTHRDLLYIDIICLLQNKEVGWKNAMHNTIGKSFIERLTAALWYIDPHCIKFTARYLSLGELFNELDQYKKDQHYNLFYNTGKHAKSNLKRDKLEQLASSLELSAMQPWAANDNWELIINEVFILISSMRKYANNLEQINQAMKEIHLSDTPARQPANDLKTTQARVIASIQGRLPQYFSRQMQKNVVKKYSLIRNVTPAFLRVLYHDLTGDAATTSNEISKELEERLCLMLAIEDPSIICDLRQNNGFKETKFDLFWNELEAYFNERLLEERIERLVLHGEPFQCYTPVDKTEIDEFFDNKTICQNAINNWNYSCGSPFVPEDHILYNEVFVREKISCETPIELAYYSCRKSNINGNICYWCGYDNELAEPSESLKSKYKSLFPCCTLCRDIGKEFFVRGEIKTHTKATKKRKVN